MLPAYIHGYMPHIFTFRISRKAVQFSLAGECKRHVRVCVC